MKKISIILAVFLLMQTPEALAAINGQGIFDDVQNQFKIAASSWANTLTARASWLCGLTVCCYSAKPILQNFMANLFGLSFLPDFSGGYSPMAQQWQLT
jgi:hypothetical protein